MKNQSKRNKVQNRELMKLAKVVTDKKIYKKLKKIRDVEEKLEVIKYSLVSGLERKYHKLEKVINEKEKKNKDVNIIKNKSILIPSKIKHFQVEFSKEEFYKVYNLLKLIEKEVKNV